MTFKYLEPGYKAGVIIPAAGKGMRAGLLMNKVFAPIGRLPVLARSMLPFLKLAWVDEVIVSLAPAEISLFEEKILTIKEVGEYQKKNKGR